MLIDLIVSCGGAFWVLRFDNSRIWGEDLASKNTSAPHPHPVTLAAVLFWAVVLFLLLIDALSVVAIIVCWALFVCLFVLLLYVPSQQLWSLRDGQFT